MVQINWVREDAGSRGGEIISNDFRHESDEEDKVDFEESEEKEEEEEEDELFKKYKQALISSTSSLSNSPKPTSKSSTFFTSSFERLSSAPGISSDSVFTPILALSARGSQNVISRDPSIWHCPLCWDSNTHVLHPHSFGRTVGEGHDGGTSHRDDELKFISDSEAVDDLAVTWDVMTEVTLIIDLFQGRSGTQFSLELDIFCGVLIDRPFPYCFYSSNISALFRDRKYGIPKPLVLQPPTSKIDIALTEQSPPNEASLNTKLDQYTVTASAPLQVFLLIITLLVVLRGRTTSKADKNVDQKILSTTVGKHAKSKSIMSEKIKKCLEKAYSLREERRRSEQVRLDDPANDAASTLPQIWDVYEGVRRTSPETLNNPFFEDNNNTCTASPLKSLSAKKISPVRSPLVKPSPMKTSKTTPQLKGDTKIGDAPSVAKLISLFETKTISENPQSRSPSPMEYSDEPVLELTDLYAHSAVQDIADISHHEMASPALSTSESPGLSESNGEYSVNMDRAATDESSSAPFIEENPLAHFSSAASISETHLPTLPASGSRKIKGSLAVDCSDDEGFAYLNDLTTPKESPRSKLTRAEKSWTMQSTSEDYESGAPTPVNVLPEEDCGSDVGSKNADDVSTFDPEKDLKPRLSFSWPFVRENASVLTSPSREQTQTENDVKTPSKPAKEVIVAKEECESAEKSSRDMKTQYLLKVLPENSPLKDNLAHQSVPIVSNPDLLPHRYPTRPVDTLNSPDSRGVKQYQRKFDICFPKSAAIRPPLRVQDNATTLGSPDRSVIKELPQQQQQLQGQNQVCATPSPSNRSQNAVSAGKISSVDRFLFPVLINTPSPKPSNASIASSNSPFIKSRKNSISRMLSPEEDVSLKEILHRRKSFDKELYDRLIHSCPPKQTVKQENISVQKNAVHEQPLSTELFAQLEHCDKDDETICTMSSYNSGVTNTESVSSSGSAPWLPSIYNKKKKNKVQSIF